MFKFKAHHDDRQRDPHARSAEVWFWGFCMFLLTTPFMFNLTGQDPHLGVARNLLTMSASASGGAAKAYMMRFTVTVIAVAAAWPQLIASSKWVQRYFPLLLLVSWAILSIAWTDSVRTTSAAAVMLGCVVVAGAAMAARLPPHLFARAMIYSGIVMAAFSLFFVFALPRFGVHQESDASQAVHAGAWRGVYMHKNMLGQTAAVYAVLILCAGGNVLRSGPLKAGLVGLMLFIIAKTDSSSALIIIVLAPLLMWALVMLGAERRMIVISIAGPFLIALLLGANAILAMVGRDMTFSGRTRIWGEAPHSIAQSPLIGWGFESPTYGGFVYRVFSIMGVTDAHNGFIEIMLGLGVIGAAILCWCLYVLWRHARRMYEAGGVYRQAAIACFAVTAAWLVACMSESDMRPMGPIPALGFLSAGILLYQIPYAARSRPRLPMQRTPHTRKEIVAHG